MVASALGILLRRVSWLDCGKCAVGEVREMRVLSLEMPMLKTGKMVIMIISRRR